MSEDKDKAKEVVVEETTSTTTTSIGVVAETPKETTATTQQQPEGADVAVVDGLNPESSNRPLAYVERIASLNPIEGADVIELAEVRGWGVVVKKNLYNVGDLVVYCEIDSILPPWEYFIADKLDKAKFRIKTIKLRGVLSQGYCIPIPALRNHPHKAVVVEKEGDVEVLVDGANRYRLDVGTDLTDYIGIRKYEIMNEINIFGGGEGSGRVFSPAKSTFPDFIRKTDQTRVQNLTRAFEEYQKLEWEVTEKLEGSSITAFFHRGKFGICSRNITLNENDDGSIAVRTVMQMGVREKLEGLGRSIALQGELIGPGVQLNIYGLPAHLWRIFDIFLIDQQRYCTPTERQQILEELGLMEHLVPVLHKRYSISEMTIKSILQMADGNSVLRKVAREGLVFKCHSVVKGEVLSFKAISNNYELKKSSK